MKTIFKKVIAAVTVATMMVTLFAGFSASTDVKADAENLVTKGTWSFYAANYSWRTVMPEPYDQATLNSLKTDSETIDCTFSTYKKYDENGQPLKGTLWGDDIIFSDPLEVTATKPSLGFEANINSWGWAGEYQGETLVGDAPYTLTGIVTVPVEKGKIYNISLDLSASCQGKVNEVMTNIDKMFTINVADAKGTILDSKKVQVPYGQTQNYTLEMASLDSESLVVTVCYGDHIYSGEPANGSGTVKVSNASVTYVKDDDTYEAPPERATTTAVETTTSDKPVVTPDKPDKPTPKAKKMAKVKKLKAKNIKKGTVKITWRKVAKAKKYTVKVGKKTYTAKKAKLTVKKLKKGKRYTIKVRAKAVKGYKVAAWTKTKVKVTK